MDPGDKTIVAILVLFLAHNCVVSALEIHYDLNDTLCEEWVEENFNETAENSFCSDVNKTMYCYGDLKTVQTFNIHHIKRVERLYICGYPEPAFDPSRLLKHFLHLKYLKIAFSNFTHISNDFPFLHFLEVVNITNTSFAFTRPSLFKKLTSLRILDLRKNKLDHMEGPMILLDKFEAMYLSGNQWNCTRNMKWLLKYDEGRKVMDKDLMRCVDLKYNARPLLAVMDFKQTMRQECLHPEISNCSCSLSYIRPSVNGDFLIPMYTVNCSNREFKHLPEFLPKNTTILHIGGNHIESLDPLRTNLIYRKVQDLYIEYNHIKSIDNLEDSSWLNKFRVLSLKGNKLTKLSYHVLDNALEQNHFAIKLYLSENPWRCDCVFTPHFQELLIKYKTLVKDVMNVTCKYLEGDPNFGTSVIKLNRADVCTLPSNYSIQPIELLNIVLGLLIVFVFVKLGYDYYNYKRYSKLPWIVTKLP